MTKNGYDKQFAEMSLDELVTFCENNDDDWTNTDGTIGDRPKWDYAMREHLDRAFDKERLGMTLHDLERIDIRMNKLELDYIDGRLADAMRRSRPIGNLYDVIDEMRSDIKRINASVKVLLMAKRSDPSGATVEQMNAIKGGIPLR